MALFGFGKKKQQKSEIQIEQKKEQDQASASSDQYFYQVNGMWMVNPNYKPQAKTEKPVNVTFSSGSSSWSEDVDAFLARNPDAKLVKLTGKPEEFAFYNVGDRCNVQEDEDADGKYNVLSGDDIIGRLPASAITYAEKHDSLPEMLSVIIADIDYDIEKDRDIISVYIA